MNDEFIQQLNQMAAYAAGVASLITPREGAEGRDSTGAVLVRLGPDAVPQSIQVEFDWKQRLRSGPLGRAVVEAADAASKQQSLALAELFRTARVQTDADRLRERLEVGEPAARIDAAAKPPPVPTQPRDLNAMIRSAVQALDNMEQVLAAAESTPLHGVGRSAFGRVSVTLSPAGIVACEVDPHWAADRDDQEISGALATALAAAREDLARSTGLGGLKLDLSELHS
jgi:hypothetical protein